MDKVNSKVFVYLKENENWKEIGRTEIIEKSSSPSFTKKITLYDYEAKLKSELQFSVEDSVHGTLGTSICKVSDIIESKDKTKNLTLSQKDSSLKATTGYLKIKFEIVKREGGCSLQ